MIGAIVIPMALPWLDRSPVKSMRYKGSISRIMLMIFVISFFILRYLGTQAPSKAGTIAAQICTALYFAYFILMPWYTRVKKRSLNRRGVTG